MKLCMPTLDDQGLAAELSGHFGGAPRLTLLDSESGDASALKAGHTNGKAAVGWDCSRGSLSMPWWFAAGSAEGPMPPLRSAGFQSWCGGLPGRRRPRGGA